MKGITEDHAATVEAQKQGTDVQTVHEQDSAEESDGNVMSPPSSMPRSSMHQAFEPPDPVPQTPSEIPHTFFPGKLLELATSLPEAPDNLAQKSSRWDSSGQASLSSNSLSTVQVKR